METVTVMEEELTTQKKYVNVSNVFVNEEEINSFYFYEVSGYERP